MIARLCGEVKEKRDGAVLVEVYGLQYEVLVPAPVMQRLDAATQEDGRTALIIYHYIQIGPSSGVPILVGFLNDIERDFFLQFIKVSGIGPRAAVRAINRPISEISRAIADSDEKVLKSLPGIGAQKAREIIAKLQGKVGKYGLLQDAGPAGLRPVPAPSPQARAVLPDWQEEVLAVLGQLQYRKSEAREMMERALSRNPAVNCAEDLLNEIYQQRIHT